MVRMTPRLAALRAERAAEEEAAKRARWKQQAAEQRAKWAAEAARIEAAHEGRMLHDFLVSEECRQTVENRQAIKLLNLVQERCARIWNGQQFRSLLEELPEDWHVVTPEELELGFETTQTIFDKYEVWRRDRD